MKMSWKILIERGNLGFSAAHFITYGDQCEPLHGHNYGVRVEVTGSLTADNYLLDFTVLKQITRDLCKAWDHRFLLPLQNPALRVSEQAEGWRIEFDAENRYTLAKSAVVTLPIANATAERLAEQLAQRILDELRARGLAANLTSLTVGIEETEMQTAFHTIALPQAAEAP